MKRLLLLFAAIITFSLSAFAANRTVQGVVIGAEDGEPLVGATVMGVGTQIGASTDIDGHFTISLPENVKSLKVSYVGMETREVPITDGMMKIELSSSNVLEEVIAVAFGTAKKSAFTGSAAVVGAEELSKRVTTNVADALVGTVPGLQMRGSSGAPGSDQGSMNIRGISSMFADTDPLVIVDGSPYPASLSNIPQGDIESITVLKDAASAALYGSRGASGVIIITTKTGSDKESRVSLDAKWGANTRAIQRYDVIDNAGEFYEAYYDQVYNYYRYGNGYSHQQANLSANNKMLSDLAYNVYNVPAGQTLIGLNGKLNPYATLGNIITSRGQQFYLTPDNWDDLSYHTGLRQEYNVTVNGGTDKASYYASLGYLDDEGFIRGSGYERLTARFKGDFQAKPWLKLGINAGYVHSTTKQVPNRSVESSSMTNENLAYYTDYIAPIYPAFVRGVDADGKPYIKTDEYGHVAYDYGTPNSGYYLQRAFMGNGNPIGSNKYNKVETIGNQLNASFTADFILTSYLKANITSSVTWGETELSDFENPWYGSKASSNGQLDKSTTTTMRTNNIQTLTYFDAFGLHNVNVMAGHEWYKSEERYLYAMARGSFSPWIPEINAFASRPTSQSYKKGYNVEGYFGRAQYDYDSKYFASVSYRRDASSRFDKAHRWGNFWSFGAAWIVNKDFFQDQAWLNMLKVKASVGQQGNDNIGNWAYIDLYDIIQSGSTTMAPSFAQIGNPEITWETTTNWNFGVEFGLFDNRLTGSIDGYYKRTNDLLFWLNIPESQGSRGYWSNIGDISNAGIEVVLNGTIIRNRNVNWNVNLNFAHNATKVLSLPESKKIYGGFSNSENNVAFWYEEGKPLYNLYLPAYAGVNEKGEALYYTDSSIDMAMDGQNAPATKKDGTTTDINLAPSYELGTSLPKLFGGFGTSVQAYGFDASVQFDFSLGGKVYDAQYAMYMSPAETTKGAGQTYHRDYKKSWSPENPNSNIPRWQFGDKYTTAKSDRFLTSARYLNFQSFTVGYTLPRFWKEISKVRVFVMGENLCFWSARKGLDPRYAYSGNNGLSPYSPARNISGGVQVTF